MMRNLLLAVIVCTTLHAADTPPDNTQLPNNETIQKRIKMSMDILKAPYNNLDLTTNNIQKIEHELKKSDEELAKTKDASLKNKLEFGRRYLASARQKLDKEEEKNNPAYYDVSSISDYTSQDYSFDTLIIAQYLKNKEKEKNSSKQAPEKIVPFYKLFLAFFIMCLISQQ